MVTRRTRKLGGYRGGGDGGRDRAAAAVSTHYTGGGAVGDGTSRRPSVMHRWRWIASASVPGRRRLADGGVGAQGRSTAFFLRGRGQLGLFDGTLAVGRGGRRIGGTAATGVSTADRLATTGSRVTRTDGRDRGSRRAWLVRIRLLVLIGFRILTGIWVWWDHNYCISASGRRRGLGTLCIGCMWGSLIFCKMQQN